MVRNHLITRRQALVAAAGVPALAAAPPYTAFDAWFVPIMRGYLRNARHTSASYAVCDFQDGTILKGSVGKSGKTYDSVSRMLPALAAWAANRKATPELLHALRLTFRNAFDPEHPDYWLAPAPERSNQRQVESSVVAWALWLLRDKLLPKMTPRERANIQAWLAACTRYPVRRNNWAWFTAVNQAVRLDLAQRWQEFSGDAAWMIDDLKALDAMAAPGDGWYSDSPSEPMYDYYNFWVFSSHFLYWNKIVGRRYPQWSERFGRRLRLFLEKTPYFFAGNGSHVLFGRSLIYRWGVLTPLVLAYQQGLWPHSPGLLRSIVRRSLEFHFAIGGFDALRGKLRETYSAEGSREICDSYIDNGHPYWGMQAFALYMIPQDDPFWTAPEEPLPVERQDFRVRFDALAMLLVGSKASGQVRWLQARCARGGTDYRDKYTKFSYSSHFPFNILKQKERAVWDSALIFRDPRTGLCAARAGVKRGALTANGLETEWWATLNGQRIEVLTRIEIDGEFERRTHTIKGPTGIEAVEGSAPLGLAADEECERQQASGWQWIRSPRTGYAVATRKRGGWQSLETVAADKLNVIYPRAVVNTLHATLRSGETRLQSAHYASPRPMALELLQRTLA